MFTKTIASSPWANTAVANGDIEEDVNRLKRQSGGDLIVYGGGGFVPSLLHHDLIDELHLLVNPVAIGSGMRIFGEAPGYHRLKLATAKAFECRIVLQQYLRPAISANGQTPH